MRNFLADVNIKQEFGSPIGTTTTIGDIVSVGLRIAFVVAGLFILITFMIAGIQMIAGAGQSNPEKSAKAKQAATSAAIGFIIIFVAYWIIKLIEVTTGSNFITNPIF